jgi:hypothetical protein
VWFVSVALILFLVENIWIDPWLIVRSHHRLTLVPEPLSGSWILVGGLIFMVAAFLAVAQVLVMREKGVSTGKKWGTAGATICSVLLCVYWVHITTRDPFGNSLLIRRERHSVVLTWSASSSVVDGYNVYRSLKPGGPYDRLNEERVGELAFVDRKVHSGVRYYYVVRAVVGYTESLDSKEVQAAVP